MSSTLGKFRAGGRRFARAWPLAVALATLLILLLIQHLLLSPAQRAVWLNGLALFILSAAVAVPLSLAVAVLGLRLAVPGGQLAVAAILTSLLVPLFAHVASWDAGWNLWWTALSALGAEPTAAAVSPIRLGLPAAAWVHAVAAVPWCVALAVWGLANVSRTAEEQLLLDRPPAWVLWNYTLPQLELTILAMLLWILVTTTSEITVTDYFQVRTFSEELYSGFATDPDMKSVAVRMLPSIALVAAAVGWLIHAWFDRSLPRRELPRRLVWSEPAWPGQMHAAPRWWGAALSMAAALLVIGLPLAWLVVQAGLEIRADPAGRTVRWSAALLVERCGAALRDNARGLATSLLLSQFVAAGCVLSAGPLAWLARVSGRRWRMTLLVLVAITLAIPAPVLAIGVIRVMDHPRLAPLNYLYDHTAVPLWIVHVTKCWPWALLILVAATRSIPAALVDQSRLDPPRLGGAYLRWVLPMTLSHHVAAWLFVTGLSLGELSGSVLVVPPGFDLFSIGFFSTLHYGARYELASLCLIVWMLAWLLAALAWWNGTQRSGASSGVGASVN